MAFRDEAVAARARMETLEGELASARRREGWLEGELRRLEAELDRHLSGASQERLLRGDAHFGIGQVLLPIAGVLGAAVTGVTWAVAVRARFRGHLDLSPHGIDNFGRSLASIEGLGAMALLLLAVFLTALPALAAFGVLRRRKWGWTMAVTTFSLWLVPFPPLGAYGLFAFGREKIRDAFLGTGWEEMAAQIGLELDASALEPTAASAEAPIAAE